MSINNYNIVTSPFKVTSAYLNGLNADANNSTDDIHSQYNQTLRNKSIEHILTYQQSTGLWTHTLSGLGTYPYDFLQTESFGAATSGVLLEKYAVIKRPQHTVLSVNFDNAREVMSQSYMYVQMAVLVNGVYDAARSDYANFPTLHSSSYHSWAKVPNISALADGALLEVYLFLRYVAGSDTNLWTAYIKNIEMYLS